MPYKEYFIGKKIVLVLLISALLSPWGGTWAYIHGVRWLYVFLLSLLISILFNNLIIDFARRFKIFDKADERKMHSQPTPRLGGVAIYLGVIIAVLRNLVLPERLLGLILAASVIFILGLLDDIFDLSALLKLGFQLFAVAVLFFFNMYLTVIPNTVPFYNVFNYLLTVFWMVGMMNAVNFMDGLDGLASGLMLIASLFMFLFINPVDKISAYILIAIAGSLLGFLYFNFRFFKKEEAKIFLGDSGSTFLGFLISGIAVMMAWSNNNSLVSISSPVVILSIPIFDMIYITVSRVKNGSVRTFKEWIDYVGKDHLHHRLIKLGFNKFSAVMFIFLLQLCLSVTVLMIKRADSFEIFIALGQVFFIFMIVVILMLTGREKSETSSGVINENDPSSAQHL